MMQTPNEVRIPNYITLEITRTIGNFDVDSLNSEISSFIQSIQNIDKNNSATKIGSVGPYLSGLDFDKIDLKIFPDAEIVWQYFKDVNKIRGIIRLDRMIRRYLLNSGAKKTFIDNMISDFGVGNPSSIEDDVKDYIDSNISIIYKGEEFDLFVKKSGETPIPSDEYVRGDIFTGDRYKLGYFIDPNYKLTKITDLIYSFEYDLQANYYYSILFNFIINKI
jgi:hypothetical protein